MDASFRVDPLVVGISPNDREKWPLVRFGINLKVLKGIARHRGSFPNACDGERCCDQAGDGLGMIHPVSCDVEPNQVEWERRD
jgi:hypothetical protein